MKSVLTWFKDQAKKKPNICQIFQRKGHARDLGCTGGGMDCDSNEKSESWVHILVKFHYIYFHTNISGKGMNIWVPYAMDKTVGQTGVFSIREGQLRMQNGM